MTGTVAQDFLLILTVVGLGLGIGLLFDCYRLLRRRIKPG
jgi:hypothetical protein